jgi:LytS/YehU family sensor histidine kinase
MKKLLVIVLNLLFWIICGYAILSIFAPQNINIDIINDKETVKNIYGIEIVERRLLFANIIGILIKIALYYFNVYYLSKYFYEKQFKKYGKFVLITTVIAFVIGLIKNALFFGTEFYVFESFIASLWLYLFFIGISFIHIIIIRWKKEEVLKQQLKEDKLTAELKLLKSQINPHFLFNALNNLLSISEKHQQTEVSSGIAQLSEMLRFLLHDTSENFIPLSKEIEFIENYIQLNELRFDKDDPIKISFKTEGDFGTINIVPAILIPFVENAYKHGIDIYNNSFIDIKIYTTENAVIFECSNSIKAKQLTDNLNIKNSGIGLQNVKRRLDILYANKHVLKITEDNNIYKVYLKLDINA